MHLLHTTGVAAAPGTLFYHGDDGEDLQRFCYAKPDEDLEEACRGSVNCPPGLAVIFGTRDGGDFLTSQAACRATAGRPDPRA